jgi:hypothetical protein
MSSDNSTVNYKYIKGFLGYRVGDDGSVWSSWERTGRGKGNGKGGKFIIGNSWKLLRQHISSKDKRPTVHLRRNSRTYTKRVHKLVLEAFIGPCPIGMEVCHNDGNSVNNNLHNLRYDTHKANEKDKIAHGKTNRGERQGISKLTNERVLQIRKLYATGIYSLSELSKLFIVSFQNISFIVNRKTWKHI